MPPEAQTKSVQVMQHIIPGCLQKQSQKCDVNPVEIILGVL